MFCFEPGAQSGFAAMTSRVPSEAIVHSRAARSGMPADGRCHPALTLRLVAWFRLFGAFAASHQALGRAIAGDIRAEP